MRLDLGAPVDVYSEWIDDCDEVAKRKVDEEIGDANEANAEDLNFSAYGTGPESRPGMAGDGGDDLINDDDY